MRKQAVVSMFVVSAMAASLIAVGCGGGDDSAEAAPPIAKAAFIKQANAICVATQKKMSPAFGKLLRGYSKASFNKEKQKAEQVELEYVTESLVPDIQTELDELRAIGLPRGDEKKVKAILDEMQEVVDKADENPSAYPQTVSFTKSIKLAEGYGLYACPLG